jgi:hypothetical protein
MEPTTEKISTTKIMSVFFPIKPLSHKFSNGFIANQITQFIPRLKQFTDKVIVYRIDNEHFYAFDWAKEKFEDTFEVITNKTIVLMLSIDKTKNLELTGMLDQELTKNVNIIRAHRKKIDKKEQKPSYIFYTINSTKLLNNMIEKISLVEEYGSTYFILGANNAKRKELDVEKSLTTEKLCIMNYLFTVDFTKNASEESLNEFLKKKVGSSLSSMCT